MRFKNLLTERFNVQNGFHFNKLVALVVATCMGSVGTAIFMSSKAATVATKYEAETSVLSGGATQVNDTNASGGKAVKFIPTSYRLPYVQPFAQDAPFNMPIASTATYEASTDEKTAWISSRGASGTINYTYWSIAIAQAATSDPLVTVKSTIDGSVLASGIRIPASFQPPGCVAPCSPDGNSVIVQPDGYTAYEFYKLSKASDTEWLAKVRYQQDMRGSGITQGVRAAGISTANGLIRKTEITNGIVPHALAISIPEAGLKLAPTATDGQVSGNGKAVWPARLQDNQIVGVLEYSGPIPMGTLFAIPPSVNVETLGLSGAGLYVARAAQRYGVYITDRSSSIALYAESTTSHTDATSIKNAWQLQILPRLRRVTNNTSTNVGGGSLSPLTARLTSLAIPFDPSIPSL